MNVHTVLITLLTLNLLLLLYIGFIKKDALWLETMKVGGVANMAAVQQLYNSDMYKTQQSQAIQQVLGSLNQNPTAQPQPEVQVQPIAE